MRITRRELMKQLAALGLVSGAGGQRSGPGLRHRPADGLAQLVGRADLPASGPPRTG